MQRLTALRAEHDAGYRHLDGGGTGGKRDDVGGGIVATLPVLRIENTKSSFLSHISKGVDSPIEITLVDNKILVSNLIKVKDY
jgi:hypothetical protein